MSEINDLRARIFDLEDELICLKADLEIVERVWDFGEAILIKKEIDDMTQKLITTKHNLAVELARND